MTHIQSASAPLCCAFELYALVYVCEFNHPLTLMTVVSMHDLHLLLFQTGAQHFAIHKVVANLSCMAWRRYSWCELYLPVLMTDM